MPVFARPCVVFFLFFGILLLGSIGNLVGAAQVQPAAQSRVTQPVSDAPLVTLRGNTLRAASPSIDRGPVRGSVQAQRLMLILKRSPQQEADLQDYLQSVQKPGSPEFRKFLSPDEFGRRYGISDTDLDEGQELASGAWLVGGSCEQGPDCP